MRIAIISDIHANLPALEETLKSIENQEIDAIYCLGDLVGYNVWPNDIINEIRRRKIATIAGNHDIKALEVCRANKKDDSNFAYHIIGKDQIQYLSTLPAHIRLEFQFNGEPFNILMVHGSPYSNTEYLLIDKKESEFTNIFIDTRTDILVFGHTHKPYHRILTNSDKSDRKYFHAINAGSVGKPKDIDPRSCYTIITINMNSSVFKKDSIKVEFVRVEYDVEKAAKAVEDSILPNAYADMLRKAY